ncbi:RusA family crossover junction endodeoxyribonuclease [Erysipelothrix urinaevulpis]
MPMQPPTTTHQQKQVRVVSGKPIFYEPDKVKAARSKLMGHLYNHVPDEPMKGPIQLVVKWIYPMTKKSVDGQYKTTKPDLDNVQKLLLDSMTDLKFWKDDAEVSSMLVEKFHSGIPGIYIQINELK